jgi:hypothetical protein
LCLPPSIGVHHQVGSTQHDHILPQPALRARPRLTEGTAWWLFMQTDPCSTPLFGRDINGHFHGLGGQWCRILRPSAPILHWHTPSERVRSRSPHHSRDGGYRQAANHG